MHSVTEVRTKDGRRIVLDRYDPVKQNGRVMLIAANGRLTKSYYDSFAKFFQLYGYAVVTFDYRGIEGSDIDAVILDTKDNYPLQEIIYVGHCTGGEKIGLSEASQYISKLVLINSARSCIKHWPLKNKLRFIAIILAGKLLGRKYTDIPKSFAIHSAHYRKLNVPLLCFSFSDDWRCPPRAVKELLVTFTNSTITWHHIKPADVGLKTIGHHGFFQPPMKKTGWTILLRWLESDSRIY